MLQSVLLHLGPAVQAVMQKHVVGVAPMMPTIDEAQFNVQFHVF